MTGLRIEDADDRVRISNEGGPLAEYVFRTGRARSESPRPYFHPVRTIGGVVVSSAHPADHVWHAGISLALPFVDDANFWGGPTFVKGRGYVQLPNNGVQRHRSFSARSEERGRSVGFVEAIDWETEDAEILLEERRTVAADVLNDEAWLLCVETQLCNVTSRPLAFGSPTTRGREDAGYGGLFWRGTSHFVGGDVLTSDTSGGDDLRGTRSAWMGISSRANASEGSSTLLVLDDHTNLQHPPQWFVRSSEYAGLCPAPFYSEERTLEPGAALRLRHAVVIADGESDVERAGEFADAGQRGMTELWSEMGSAGDLSPADPRER